MNIQEFNEKAKALGQELFGENYGFSATQVDSTNYGHEDRTEITYRATIFIKAFICGHSNISGSSKDIELVFDNIRNEYKNIMAKPSTHIEL